MRIAFIDPINWDYHPNTPLRVHWEVGLCIAELLSNQIPSQVA